jgi:hypothetical protein
MSHKHTKHTGRRNHHAFLFHDHVQRSKKSVIKLHNREKNASQHFANCAAIPLPKWKTPDEWGTETAADIIQKTGRFLLESILLGGDTSARAAKKIKMQSITTDTSQQDVDTVLALLLGMTEEASLNYPDLQLDRASNLRFNHALFQPPDVDDNTTTTRCNAKCSLTQTASCTERPLKTAATTRTWPCGNCDFGFG